MAMNAYKWDRLAHDLGSTVAGSVLSAASAAGRTTLQMARLASTKPEHYTARFAYWDAVVAPYDAPPVVTSARL